jgi:N utilization substance protein A
MNAELLRFVDSISRDKNIDKESIYVDIETAIASAVRKAYSEEAAIAVTIDRVVGDISATVDNNPVDMKTLGRIAAQTAKQVLIQKVREDERNSIFEEYSAKVGTVMNGTISRIEGSALIVNIGRAEAIMPRSEQIPGQTHHVGERIRGMLLDVREERNQVRIVLTQTHPDYIRRLFELEVPEVGERIIEIRALAREPGYRTKVAVTSIDAKVDAVGACVGVRGSRIRNIVDELGGEKIDIVRFNESSQILIANALKPAEVQETFLCFELGKATVIVADDQLSLAIGKKGQNVRLASRLTGWDIDILTPAEYNRSLDAMERALKQIEGVEDVMLDKLLAIGIISLHDITDVGAEALMAPLAIENELSVRIVQASEIAAKQFDIDNEAAKALAAQQLAAARAALAAGGPPPVVADAASADASDVAIGGDAASTLDAEVAVDAAAPDAEAAVGAEDESKASAMQDATPSGTSSEDEPLSA